VRSGLKTLRGRGDLKLELKRNNKDRGYGAHLVFYALPTDLSPTVDSCKVPAWNKWDPALPLLFFQTAKPILTDNGVLALLYADTFENVHDVAKGLREVDVFEPFKNWTVRLDCSLFDVHQLCKVRPPLVCYVFMHCATDVYFCFHFFHVLSVTNAELSSRFIHCAWTSSIFLGCPCPFQGLDYSSHWMLS
jgi:hypothetical protein